MGLFSSIGKAIGSVTGLLGDGGTAALIGGGLGLLGGANDNAASAKAAATANEFTKEMYQNRYQWQTADMRKAGINPLLSVQNAPPGTPSGAQAQVFSQADRAINGASAAANVRLQNESVKKVQAETLAASTQAAKTAAETIKLGRDEPLGKFVKQAGNNALKQLDKLPPPGQFFSTIKNSVKSFLASSSDLTDDDVRKLRSQLYSSERPYLNSRTMKNLNSGVLYKN